MSNILTPFKKFFKNKNTVTIMCIFLGVLTLVIGYNYRVSIATDLVSVPYALKEIPKKTQITKDMIAGIGNENRITPVSDSDYGCMSDSILKSKKNFRI